MPSLLARLGLVASLVSAAGCGMFSHTNEPATQLDPSVANRANEWNASLSTPSELAGAVQVRGNAAWGAGDSGKSVVNVSISNATPGGVHPWHVHQGRCGSNGPIVGSAAAYKPLAVNDAGNASALAELDMPLPSGGDYYVNIHASSANLGTIVACGNLAPPVR